MKKGKPVKKYKIVALFFILLVASTASTLTALGAGNGQIIDPTSLPNPTMLQDEHAPALASIAALYAPMNTKDQWIKQVCMGMTTGGCKYFKSNQADALWVSQAGHDGSSVGGHISDVTVINATAQVWQAQVTIFSNAEEFKPIVFVLVERDAHGWYLNRVLYGPGISQVEF